MKGDFIWGLFIVIVILVIVGVFLFDDQIDNVAVGNDSDKIDVIKYVIDERCATCGNRCVTMEFAMVADCIDTTEDFGCKYEYDECKKVENDCVFTKDINYVCGSDGKTYTNPSFAKCYGVEIAYEGKCGENGYYVDNTGVHIVGDDPVCGDEVCESIEGIDCPSTGEPNAGCFENKYYCPKDCDPKEDYKCGNYIRNEVTTKYCATCGNGVCDNYEQCISSLCTVDGVCTNDCGSLYCPEDC